MGNLTANDHKAIAWYSEENNLIPQLSSWPTISFKKRGTGEDESHEIAHILGKFEAHKKEKSKWTAAKKRSDRNLSEKGNA